MNERIKELLQKAGMESADFPYDEFGIPYEHMKFAELIVRECLTQNKLAIQSLKDNPEDIPGFKTIMNLAQVTCRNQIVEHFGVEE